MKPMQEIRILDTMTVSHLMKGQELAVARLSQCKRNNVLVPQPVLAEIFFGLARLADGKRKSNLQGRFDLLSLHLKRAPWCDEVSLQFGKVKALLESQGQPLEDFDVAIAAHALAHNSILVSDNLRHLQRIPDLVLESWGSPTQAQV
jgi:tRNA(fMet)-specific endonuclease VapC